MAFDEELADRVRAAVGGAGVVAERRMFGGLSFLVDGRLAVAVGGQGGLLVQVAGDDRESLLTQPGVAPMVMGGRESRTWLHVHGDALRTEEQLGSWVARGVATARTRT